MSNNTVSVVGSVAPFAITVNARTVDARPKYRTPLSGGASRNSIKLGGEDEYSKNVNTLDTKQTSATICAVSVAVPPSINDGVAIIKITRTALKTAPESSEITALLPSFRPAVIRCHTFVPF
jgi:hypothetical protein